MTTHRPQRVWQQWNRPVAAVVAAFALFGFGILWNTIRIGHLQHQRSVAVAQKTSAQAEGSAQASIANEGKALAQNVTDRCRTDRQFRDDNPQLCPQASRLATATPSPIVGPVGPQGPAPSEAQVRSAVNAYLAVHPPPINYTVLRAFVNSYLSTHPAPSGPPGARGATGPPGSSVTGPSGAAGPSGSSVTGPPGASGSSGQDGSNATDSQIAAAVATYCSDHGGCAGPTGPAGPDVCDRRGGTWATETDLPPLKPQETHLVCVLPGSGASS